MLVNYAPGEECRVAILEDGQLEEYHDERTGAVSCVGNVYVGRVTNVEPGIQAAFIDFGQEASGFLHVTDVHPQYFPAAEREATETVGRKTPRRERPPIQQCLKKGQELIVQVLKEGINTKGPTLTSYISIPGRYLVMLPDMDRVGVSRKVEDDEQRREMRKVLDGLSLPDGFGFILRTAGRGKGKMDLKRDLAYLQRLWKDLEKRRKTSGKGPRLLYAESDLLMRALRDFWTSDTSAIIIDEESALERAGRFMRIVSPRSSTKLLRYDRSMPLFHAYGIEEQIALTHSREVPLKSGGSLVIDETEAMIAIDVNSGRMRHHGDAETTAYRTNLEAVDEICRQIRLRDVGGLVLCDLIDMMSRSHRRTIEQRFRDRLKRDRAASKTLAISQFGIVEMTRQRQKQSVRSAHFAKCPQCAGRGVLKRPDSVADEAMRELAVLVGHERVSKVELVVSPRVASELLSRRRATLGRHEAQLGKPIDVRVSEDIPVDRVSFYAYDDAGADVDIHRLPTPQPPTNLSEWASTTRGDAHWAVDTLREEPEEVPAELDGEFAEGDVAAIELSDAGEAPDEGKKKRRRRRGSRGGRGRSKPKSSEERTADSHAQKVVEAGAEEQNQPAPESEQPPEQQTLKKKRRRRGGRRKGRDGAATETTPPPVPVVDAATSTALRGDSWDVLPEELPVKQNVGPAHAVDTAAVNGSVSGAESTEAARDEAPVKPSARKRRSKASSRTRKKKTPSTVKGSRANDGTAGGTPSAEEVAAPKVSSTRASKKKKKTAKRSKKKQTSAAKPAAKGESGSTKKPADAPAERSVDAEPKPRVKRTLYGSRRRLKPAEAAVIKTSGDE